METTATPDYERGLTFEKVWAMFQETDRKFKETDLRFKETEKLVMEIAERQKETDKQLKETGKKMGYLDNRFGELAQHLVAPNIMEKFNALSFNFTRCSLNVKIKEPEPFPKLD